MLTSRSLPGIRFDTVPLSPVEILPRMDVAVFAGFAAMGPVHIPVAIESVAQYAEVFGPDAPLAWDVERGERVFAYLGAAVRGFFSNGGQRCWVIRVARTRELETRWCQTTGGTIRPHELAVVNRYAVPGVLAFPADGSRLASAEVQARSVGSWSDGLRLQTALIVTGFELRDCRLMVSQPDTRISFHTAASLQAGDLIELHDPAASGMGGIKYYATVDSIIGIFPRRVEATLRAVFEPVSKSLESLPLPVIGEIDISGIAEARIHAILQVVESDSAAVPQAKIEFTITGSAGLMAGQWIRWAGHMQTVVWLRIDRLAFTPDKITPNRVNVEAIGTAWREIPGDAFGKWVSPVPAWTRAQSLTMDMQVLSEQTHIARLAGVGLTASHRNAWWRQVSDTVYYKHSDDRSVSVATPGFTETSPRFPLAARDEELGGGIPLAWIPLGVTTLYGEALAPLPQAAAPLERDGLSRFDAELFLDPDLASLRSHTLIEQAEAIRYLSDTPRTLFGIHAALSIGTGGMDNEASLIAVPDALHIGWMKHPSTLLPPLPTVAAEFPVHWYAHRGACTAIPDGMKLDKPDFSRFLDCGTRQLSAPTWKKGTDVVPRGMLHLEWESNESHAVFLLEEATRTDFKDAREIYRGSAREHDVSADFAGIYYYRVIAIAGDEWSTPSDTLAVRVRDDAWVMQPAVDYDESGVAELLHIHRALLRLAAASGEWFAVLGLPRHYRATEAIRYGTLLRAPSGGAGGDPNGLDFNERRALSYGALYHPWIVSTAPRLPTSPRANVETQRVYPPDGIVTGLMAARATQRGAWIAPSNAPFREMVALMPSIESSAWQSLQDAQINLIRADARGFLTLTSDTLSDESELRPVNVRRLLILLRRMALRRGARYVFEPDNDVLRRAVERGFTFLLTDLFRRGAFAGETPAKSFSVVTGRAARNGIDRDSGCFFVELRIAPSIPLQFLTIRLSQRGERFTVMEG
ncbi:MAG: hypothetical protein KF908_02070 [Nitrosomonas sp.]|nr:hypothetical protein [Nitrosomonas sp.]